MKAVRLPTLKYLEECLLLETSTNKLYWKRRPRNHFTRQSDWRRWNNVHAGKEAFCTINQQGYANGVIGRQIYLTHRIIWKLIKRREPPPCLDHVDGNKANNWMSNVRAATYAQNCHNRTDSGKNPASGYRGVYKSHSKWMATIFVNGQKSYLGTFATKEQASAAWTLAAQRLHGEFYRA